MTTILLAVGLGCLWHGVQVIWVAPLPTQLRKDKPPRPQDAAQAFQIFWLDQYGWIGISLALIGVGFIVAGVLG